MKMLPLKYEDRITSLVAVIRIEFEGTDDRQTLEKILPNIEELVNPKSSLKPENLPKCPHCGAQPCELRMQPSFVPPQFLIGVSICKACKKIVGTVLLGQQKPQGRIQIPA